MKQGRPSLRDVVRSPEMTAFIDRGVVSAPADGGPLSETEVLLSVSVPAELFDALKVTMEGRGISLPEAVREMLLDYLMKG